MNKKFKTFSMLEMTLHGLNQPNLDPVIYSKQIQHYFESTEIHALLVKQVVMEQILNKQANLFAESVYSIK